MICFMFQSIYIFVTFSTTRHISETISSGDEVSGLPPRGLPAAFLKSRQPLAKKRPRPPRPTCPACKKGFQFARNPPLQLKCKTCPSYVHLRCLTETYDEENFRCQTCSPAMFDGSLNQVFTEDIANVPSTSVMMTSPQFSYGSFPRSRFVERMQSLGFQESPTQPNTPADGNCALWACLDGYNNIKQEESMFPRDNAMYLRFVKVYYMNNMNNIHNINFLQDTHLAGAEEATQS